MIIIDLFDIDIHIFTVIKFLFNLGVRFNYISLSLLPILFLSQRLVFVTVVFVVIIIWVLVSSSFHSWCYWAFLFVCWYAIDSFFTFPHAVPSLFSFCSVSTFSYTTWILIPKVINVYEKRRFILLFVDDTLCTW